RTQPNTARANRPRAAFGQDPSCETLQSPWYTCAPRRGSQMKTIQIGKRLIGDGQPLYFVADIAANHDGSLERAYKLIELAKEAGADAAKFQNFQAAKIVSKHGFEKLGGMSHQASWKKPVFD